MNENPRARFVCALADRSDRRSVSAVIGGDDATWNRSVAEYYRALEARQHDEDTRIGNARRHT
jgi:hypothetical protein